MKINVAKFDVAALELSSCLRSQLDVDSRRNSMAEDRSSTKWKNLRARLHTAQSIEETGLISSLDSYYASLPQPPSIPEPEELSQPNLQNEQAAEVIFEDQNPNSKLISSGVFSEDQVPSKKAMIRDDVHNKVAQPRARFVKAANNLIRQEHGNERLRSIVDRVMKNGEDGLKATKVVEGFDSAENDNIPKNRILSTPPNLFQQYDVDNIASTSQNRALDASKMTMARFAKPGQSSSGAAGARNRWRRLKHTVAFANHMAANLKSSADDLLEVQSPEDFKNCMPSMKASDKSKTLGISRAKGRKGMEGLVVKQNKSCFSYFQDFYVACLKMPMSYFLASVLLAPVALGLLFLPLYMYDVSGLRFIEDNEKDLASCAEQALSRRNNLGPANVFLYAFSLSTTFGGSPITALSPYCLMVANIHTLLAQFLFVFVSGAVFARMSQPSQPIRCATKAIIKNDEFTPNIEKFKVLAVRLVLTGPAPCELVDAKICLAFRIFVKLPSGTMFCSTQELELVRSEVSYLRYGLMVRHIIDENSPLYEHTMETLIEGDASFSLTIVGMERSSMQQIFHLQDYFACDGDVVWDGDYIDFVEVNDKGQRVLDHSKLDALKSFKAVGIATQAVKRMEADVAKHKKMDDQIEDQIEDVDSMRSCKNRSTMKEMEENGTPMSMLEVWKNLSQSFNRS